MSGTQERPEESLARRRLEPYVGSLEPADVPGTSGVPDYKIVASGAADGYLEVTSRPDKVRRQQRAALRKGRDFKVSLTGRWTLHLHRDVDTRSLASSPGLREILAAARKEDRLLTTSNGSGRVAELMHLLGIEAVKCWDADDQTGTVSLSTGTTGAVGVQGDGVDEWLEAAFEEPGVVDHVRKLRRAGGNSRHLYLEIDSSSESGLAIALSLDVSTDPGAAPYRLPAYEPPNDVTDLWVWPDCPGPGLHFKRDRGWEIVADVPWE
jgi:hypothetical protein